MKWSYPYDKLPELDSLGKIRQVRQFLVISNDWSINLYANCLSLNIDWLSDPWNLNLFVMERLIFKCHLGISQSHKMEDSNVIITPKLAFKFSFSNS